MLSEHVAEVGRNGERYRMEVKKGVNNEIRKMLFSAEFRRAVYRTDLSASLSLPCKVVSYKRFCNLVHTRCHQGGGGG